MKVKINRNAAKVLKEMLNKEENQGKMVRVFVTSQHGDHVHYGFRFDTPGENDTVVETNKGIPVILEKDNEWLDGVWIQYFYVPEEGFIISNPQKGNNHHLY